MRDKGGILNQWGKDGQFDAFPWLCRPNKLEDGVEAYLIPDAK